MTTKQYKKEAQTLKKFFELYCDNHHNNLVEHNIQLPYNNEDFTLNVKLCSECKSLIDYSLDRLTECEYEIKPKCRTCTTSCYEKTQWKKVAKLMKYSGIKLGLNKIKSFIFGK